MTQTPISPKTDSLDAIKNTHKTLGDRVSQAQDKAALAPEAEEFIRRLRRAGQDIPPGSGRDLLRSLASYWATFVYSNSTTGVYPSTELEPYLGPPVSAEMPDASLSLGRIPIWGWVVGGAVAALLLFLAFSQALGWNLSGVSATEMPTEVVEVTEPPTETPSLATLPADILLTQTAQAGSQPSPTPEKETETAAPPTEVPSSPPPSQPPTLLPTPDAATPLPPPSQPVIGAQVTNLQEGQEVSPAETLSIQYTNLQPGWTLHLVLQPVGASGLYYPLKESFTIGSETTSGTWNVEAVFNQRLGRQYNIMPVIAISSEGNKALETGAANGLTALPEGVISLPRVLTVELAASTLIDEVRLVYSAYQAESGRIELVTSRPDGSDMRRITSATKVNKLYPAISPAGDQIVFVAREFAPSGEVQESLWVVGTGGQNSTKLLEQPGMAIERPAWSPDGSTIALGAVVNGERLIYLFDVEKQSASAITSLPAGARFPAWSPKGDVLYFSAESDRSRTTGIFQYRLSDQTSSLVYDSEGNDLEPAVSPGGDSLVFTSIEAQSIASKAPVQGIYLYVLGEKEAKLLFSSPNLPHYPRWHPEGRVIFFGSLIDNSYSVWAIEITGNGLQQITAGPADRWPAVGQVRMYLPERSGQ